MGGVMGGSGNRASSSHDVDEDEEDEEEEDDGKEGSSLSAGQGQGQGVTHTHSLSHSHTHASNSVGLGAAGHSVDHFNLAYQRRVDAVDPDVNWLIGQGDALQHVIPSLLTLSGSFLSDIEATFAAADEDTHNHSHNHNHNHNHSHREAGRQMADNEAWQGGDTSRFGNLLLTQLAASRGFCVRLLSCVLVSCAYIGTQPLDAEAEEEAEEGAPEEGENTNIGTGPGAGAGAEVGINGRRERRSSSSENEAQAQAQAQAQDRLRDREEFTRLCRTARMASEQLNVLLEFSMGSDSGPQDQKLLEAVKPELDRGGFNFTTAGGSNITPGGGIKAPARGQDQPQAGSSSTVCSMPPVVWTNLFRNLRLVTASLRAKVKPVAFNDDKASNISALLFSLDELDYTVACLQPLLAL